MRESRVKMARTEPFLLSEEDEEEEEEGSSVWQLGEKASTGLYSIYYPLRKGTFYELRDAVP